MRSLLDGLGFGNANVSVLTPPGGGAQTVRVEAKVIDDPIDDGPERAGQVRRRQPGRCHGPELRRRHVLVHRESRGQTDGRGRHQRARLDRRSRTPKVKVDGQVVTITVPKLPVSQVQTVAAALAKYAGTTANDVSITTVGPTWGHEVSHKAAQGAHHLLLRAGRVPRDPLRVEDVGRGDRGGDPRHHLHDRRLRAVPLPGLARDRHRVPDDPRVSRSTTPSSCSTRSARSNRR